MIKLQSVLIAMLLGASITVHAEKMDLDSQTLVIADLESALSGLEENNATRFPVMLRLADVYSERARLENMKEIERNCQSCLHSLDNRKRALQLYEGSIDHVGHEQKEAAILQMAHLYQLTQQNEKALKVYKQITQNSKSYSQALVGEAFAELGEFYYHKAEFKKAINEFSSAMAIQDTPRKGHIIYRIAWCHLNLGQLQSGIKDLKSILQNPQYLTDKSFHVDVSRDLATFYARGVVGAQEIETLKQLSPPDSVKDNLEYLATETDRLGNKPASLYVWNYLMKIDRSNQDTLDGHVHMAQIEYDLGHQDGAVHEMEAAASLWKSQGCKVVETCSDLKNKMRKLVIEWDKAHHKKYTTQLLRAYGIYLRIFADDLEMTYWAANVGKALKQYSQTIIYYRRAADLAQSQTNKSAEVKRMLEGSLLGEIEVAELSKDVSARSAAYDHYLNLNPDGDKNLEVRYQRARLAYDQNQFSTAAPQFHDIAVAKDHQRATLRKQAADLALDSLASLEDDSRIILWTAEFAKQFPENRNEYSEIGRKASIHQVAATLADKQASSKSIAAGLSQLESVNLSGASQESKVEFYKTQIALAERAQNLKAVEFSADALLRIPHLSQQDTEFALGKKVWVAEMRLDFNKALKSTQKMKTPSLTKAERLLRLAGLAELAHQKPDAYYRDYLKFERNHKKANLVRAKLVRNSRSPWNELNRYCHDLERDPQLLAALGLEIFIKTKDYKRAEKFLKNRHLASQEEAHFLSEYVFLHKMREINSRFAAIRIHKSNQSRMQADLKQLLALIKQSELMASTSVKSHSWTMQVVALQSLSRENERLAREILTLPPPPALNKKQRFQYSALLMRQSAAFARKSQQIQAKLQEFWNDTAAIDRIITDFEQTKGDALALATQRLQTISNNSPLPVAKQFNRALSNHAKRPTLQEILLARQAVKEHPFDESRVQNLKRLEEMSGGDVMSVYLEARLDQLHAGVKP